MGQNYMRTNADGNRHFAAGLRSQRSVINAQNTAMVSFALIPFYDLLVSKISELSGLEANTESGYGSLSRVEGEGGGRSI